MPVSFTKPEANPATQNRLAEVGRSFQRMTDELRAAAPGLERRLAEIGASLRSAGERADR